MASFSVHALTSLLVPLYTMECIALASVGFRVDHIDVVLSKFHRWSASTTGNAHQLASVRTNLSHPTDSDAVSLGFLSERGVDLLPFNAIEGV